MNSHRSEYRRELYRDREQSYVKHVILRTYLERFAHIIGSWADSITYVDGFSGPWQTKSEEFGDTSFGIAIDELRKARQHLLESMDKQVALRCFFVESDRKSFERLDAFRRRISDIEIRLANSKFEAALPQIQSFIQEPRGKKFAFILVDPKGWDGFSMSAMAELLRLPFVEVVVNFMTSFIKRFLESPNDLTQIQLEALFGDGSFRGVIEGLSGIEREYAALDAYAKNLAKVGNFGYVCKALVLNPEMDKTHYHLVYATRNSKGAEVFKKAVKGHERDELGASGSQPAKERREKWPERFVRCNKPTAHRPL